MKKVFQEVLTMSTSRPNLKSEAHSWDFQSSLDMYATAIENHQNFEQAETWRCSSLQNPNNTNPQSPLNALACGWKLLAPPTKIGQFAGLDEWEWWFVRDVEY